MAETEPGRKIPAWRPIIAAMLLASGIGIVATSFVWTHVSSGKGNWSTEQARQYQAAALKLHSLSHEYAHQARQGDDRAMREQLESAQRDYESLHGQLDAAIARPRNIAFRMRVVGVALMIAGGYGLYQSRAVPTT